MRILLDECVTKRLRAFLDDYEVLTVTEMQWNGLRNGQLMAKAAADHFDLFLTIDKNLLHQQNIGKYDLIVVVLDSPSSALDSIKQFIPSFQTMLPTFEKKNAYVVSR